MASASLVAVPSTVDALCLALVREVEGHFLEASTGIDAVGTRRTPSASVGPWVLESEADGATRRTLVLSGGAEHTLRRYLSGGMRRTGIPGHNQLVDLMLRSVHGHLVGIVESAVRELAPAGRRPAIRQDLEVNAGARVLRDGVAALVAEAIAPGVIAAAGLLQQDPALASAGGDPRHPDAELAVRTAMAGLAAHAGTSPEAELFALARCGGSLRESGVAGRISARIAGIDAAGRDVVERAVLGAVHWPLWVLARSDTRGAHRARARRGTEAGAAIARRLRNVVHHGAGLSGGDGAQRAFHVAMLFDIQDGRGRVGGLGIG